MRITIVGCGSIGSKLAKFADGMEEVKRIYLLDVQKKLAEDLKAGVELEGVAHLHQEMSLRIR